MIKMRKRSQAIPALSTASLPDIVFILLFFFMVATHIRTENTNAQLPKVDFASQDKSSLVWKLALDPKMPGYYFLNDQPLTADELTSKIKTASVPMSTIQIYMDKKAPMKELSQIKKLIASHRIDKIQYMVYH